MTRRCWTCCPDWSALDKRGCRPELWSIEFSPLFSHLKRKAAPDDLGTQLLKPLLLHLEQGEEYAFLRGTPEFEALVCRCRGEKP